MEKTLMIIEKNPSGSEGLKKAKERGLYIIFLSSNKYHNKLNSEDKKYVNFLVEMDTNNLDLVIEKAKYINARRPLNGVLTFMEFCVPQAAYVACELGLNGISLESANSVRNKYLMREKFNRKNIPIPKYKAIRNLDEAKEFAKTISYPNIIKPVNLAGSRCVLKNNNALELEKNFDIVKSAIPPFGVKSEELILLEEYMDGPEFSVEAVSYKGKTTIVAITKKLVAGENTFVEIGHVVPAELDSEAEKKISDLAYAAIDALGIYSGISHTEIKLTKDGPKIVEVAGRLGGDHIPELVELALGIDLWAASISIALGEEPDILPKKRSSAAISYITSNPGIVESIEDYQLVEKDCIYKVNISHKIGDTVNILSNSSDRLGYVIATGNDPKEAEFNAQDRLKKIKIQTR